MGKFRIEITHEAEKDFAKHYKSGNKSNISIIQKILLELENTPYQGIGKPEKLKYQFNSFWSRRINQKDRLVYKVDEDIVTIFVVSAMGHYLDK
ncbi:toxin YoeB [Flavobacterium sp. CG_23.5]|uniref:Txe/YoeB family addiction module toxin n=1 Tax=Flavobacterium sp. CG_23.5 TaxID=2760708 RepID=UPI001AE4960F|nr:Txe/YoeB family addiction module toxin [Flavobacterium sp. CG_23.5]MBP2284464.1 toxin YoeB [Flavobacterium sp. CG_23.5]